jgi:hypothetical protein
MLLEELATILDDTDDDKWQYLKLNEYLEGDDQNGVMHFVFRLDVPVAQQQQQQRTIQHKSRTSHHQQQRGGQHCLAQCISSEFPFADAASKRRVWGVYQRLQLRLRLGSASSTSVRNAFDRISKDHQQASGNTNGRSIQPTITPLCPAMCLAESSPPDSQRISYLIQNSETYLALNGPGYEL